MPLHFLDQPWSATHPFRSMAVMTFGRSRASRMVSFFSPRTTSSIWPVGASLYLITCKWLFSSGRGKRETHSVGRLKDWQLDEILAWGPFLSHTGWMRVRICIVSCWLIAALYLLVGCRTMYWKLIWTLSRRLKRYKPDLDTRKTHAGCEVMFLRCDLSVPLHCEKSHSYHGFLLLPSPVCCWDTWSHHYETDKSLLLLWPHIWQGGEVPFLLLPQGPVSLDTCSVSAFLSCIGDGWEEWINFLLR